MRELAGILSIGCFAGQAAAYSKSAFTHGGKQVCVVIPFGECESIIANGWAVLIQGYGQQFNLEAVLATACPLLMFYFLVLSLHNPRFTMQRGEEMGQRKISPGGWMYLLVFLAVVAVSALPMLNR